MYNSDDTSKDNNEHDSNDDEDDNDHNDKRTDDQTNYFTLKMEFFCLTSTSASLLTWHISKTANINLPQKMSQKFK